MPSDVEIRRTARHAGRLYLAMSILAMVSYFGLGSRFVVRHDPAATARNILAGESLYRTSLLIDVAVAFLFILVVLSLYRLFEDVDRPQARTMVALVGTGIAAQFAGLALHAVPLMLLEDSAHYAAFDRPQLEALAYAAIGVAGRQGDVLTAAWGLWLFPFAFLAFKSGFLPRFLGVLLLLSGIAYVATSVAAIGFPDQLALVRKLAFPLYFGEFVVVLWLAFIGARIQPAEGAAA